MRTECGRSADVSVYHNLIIFLCSCFTDWPKETIHVGGISSPKRRTQAPPEGVQVVFTYETYNFLIAKNTTIPIGCTRNIKLDIFNSGTNHVQQISHGLEMSSLLTVARCQICTKSINVCVCVCEREREREKAREKERVRERGYGVGYCSFITSTKSIHKLF